jgi:hypothetical protein
MSAFLGSRRKGKAYWLPFFGKLLAQIQTTNVERQFSPQHVKKTENMIRGLGERIGNKVDSSIS